MNMQPPTDPRFYSHEIDLQDPQIAEGVVRAFAERMAGLISAIDQAAEGDPSEKLTDLFCEILSQQDGIDPSRDASMTSRVHRKGLNHLLKPLSQKKRRSALARLPALLAGGFHNLTAAEIADILKQGESSIERRIVQEAKEDLIQSSPPEYDLDRLVEAVLEILADQITINSPEQVRHGSRIEMVWVLSGLAVILAVILFFNSGALIGEGTTLFPTATPQLPEPVEVDSPMIRAAPQRVFGPSGPISNQNPRISANGRYIAFSSNLPTWCQRTRTAPSTCSYLTLRRRMYSWSAGWRMAPSFRPAVIPKEFLPGAAGPSSRLPNPIKPSTPTWWIQGGRRPGLECYDRRSRIFTQRSHRDRPGRGFLTGQPKLAVGSQRELWIWKHTGNDFVFTNSYARPQVNALAYSPDGQWLASTMTGEVWIRRAEDGGVVARLGGHTRRVHDLAFSPAAGPAYWLATASEDGQAILWELKPDRNGLKVEYRMTLQHEVWVSTVAFSPDGAMLATGGFDSGIHLWDITSGNYLTTLHRTRQNQVLSIAFIPDGSRLVTGTIEGIFLWSRGVENSPWRGQYGSAKRE